MTAQIRAILWAQFRGVLNRFPRSHKGGVVFGGIMAALWYGGWLIFSILICRVLADKSNDGLMSTAGPAGLLFVFLYWQVVPILLISSGVSLSIKKLQVYPIPNSQLFLIEVLLRISTSLEMMLVLAGIAAGLLANPAIPKWGIVAIPVFAAFNLCLAAGVRELMVRLFERKRVREIAILAVVVLGALPQLVIATGSEHRLEGVLRGPAATIWPWSAAAATAAGHPWKAAILVLAGWTAAAYFFGRWQFERSLRFDASESNATGAGQRGVSARLFDSVLRWPSLLFKDPLAALVEKEIRFLSRAPRFRLVFAMGFTFGLFIWLPMAVGRGHSRVFGQNYLTFTCLYALLLLGDACFWNIFGFDRVAAQAYWALPVRFSTVLAGKNLSALFFVLLETTIIVCICALLRLPASGVRVMEAYGVTLVVAVYLLSLGNLTSTSNARAMNPAKAMRSGAPGRLQALLFLIYPVAATPVLLAYAARYAFDTEAAFFAVLAVCALVGAAVYWVTLETAVEAAGRNKERLLLALARGEGVIDG